MNGKVVDFFRFFARERNQNKYNILPLYVVLSKKCVDQEFETKAFL